MTRRGWEQALRFITTTQIQDLSYLNIHNQNSTDHEQA
jgi:hypothetical protein